MPATARPRFSAPLTKILMLALLAARVDFGRAWSGLFWWVRGKRLRGFNILRSTASGHRLYYALWIRHVEQSHSLAARPMTDVAILIRSTETCSADDVRATVKSMSRGLPGAAIFLLGPGPRPHHPIIQDMGEDPSAADVVSRCEENDARFVLPIDAGDEISSEAGFALAGAFADKPVPTLIYWDEDRLDARGRRTDPWVKGGWDPLHFVSKDFLTGACLVAVDALRDLADAPYDPSTLVTAAVLPPDAVAPRQVERIITHRRHRSRRQAAPERAKILAEYLDPDVRLTVGPFDTLSIDWCLPTPWPSVAILIPTRNRVDLLRPCIQGLQRLDYPGRVTILIIDNDSDDDATLSYFEDIRKEGVEVLRIEEPFNFSTLNNRAARYCKSDYLCLLNNDIEPLDGEWLARMVAHAARPGTGAVGARLLYPDRSLQHGGVVVGLGAAAGHIEKGLPDGEAGYFAQSFATRTVRAVTAACLVVSRAAYEAVGGLDEENFAVAFNDVDLCLQLHSAGYRNVYLGHVALIHHESKSRRSDYSAENFPRFAKELAALQQRWGTASLIDPSLSPHLSRSGEQIFLEI